MDNNIIEQPRFSCALGAQQSIVAIPRAIPILHCGPGCSQKIISIISTNAGHQGEGYAGGSHIPCTNMTESEVVFGGEARLEETISGALEVMDGDLFVVLTGCIADIIGDDVQAVVAGYHDVAKPVICVETGGFKGNSYFGHDLFLNGLLSGLLKDAQPKVRQGLVNVFAVVPYQNANWRGDLAEIKALLEGIGLKVNILFSYESAGLNEWLDIPNAQFNLLLSPWIGLEAVQYLEKQFGTPYLHESILPIGGENTSAFLRRVADFASLPEAPVERLIEKEENRFYDYLGSAMEFFSDMKVGLPYELYTIADSTYALAYTNFMVQEMGYVPKQVFIVDSPPDAQRAEISSSFVAIDPELQGKVTFTTDGGVIHQILREQRHIPRKSLILASQWEKVLASELKAWVVTVGVPIQEQLILGRTYLGYRGGLRLLEDIYSGILNTPGFSHRFASD
ncbi:MAG: hydrogenase [Peptococcaceae bacterium]|jgi:nitrogenase molybdenum-iron protein beta chain|nr:hydrogenase [Peptococcaceae bacterium]